MLQSQVYSASLRVRKGGLGEMGHIPGVRTADEGAPEVEKSGHVRGTERKPA